MKKRLFISHISEECAVADRIKIALTRDFLGLLDVFVSSDTDSIAAGEEWLRSIEKALRDCAVFVILCSPDSILRPWINFEAGAAWMRDIPLIPICHSGLLPHDLRMPLSLKQGIAMGEAEGLQRLYTRIAHVLDCDVPHRQFGDLAAELTGPVTARQMPSEKFLRELDHDRDIRRRMTEALQHHKYDWRTLRRIAGEAAISEEQAADFLRADPAVRFSTGKSGEIIVGLRSRVG